MIKAEKKKSGTKWLPSKMPSLLGICWVFNFVVKSDLANAVVLTLMGMFWVSEVSLVSE